MMYRIRLDLCTICNLNCPACSMRKLNYGKIGCGYVKFEQFKDFIDNNKQYIESLEISNYGEPFLNPDILDILNYAYKNNINLTCSNGTNFNFNNDELLKKLVNNNFKVISVSIDGASPEVYEKYRRNGNFNLVMANLKKLINYKIEQKSNYPKIVWQYVIRQSTENPEEIKKAKKIAEELNIPIRFKLTWEKNYIPNPKFIDQIKSLTNLTFVSRNDLPFLFKHVKCLNLINENEIVINWDGRWLGCCRNKIPSNLNVFENGIKGLIENKDYQKVRNYLIKSTDEIDDSIFCSYCSYFNINDNYIRKNLIDTIYSN